MKKITTVLVLLITKISFAQNTQPDQHNEFDFWVGEWDAVWYEKDSLKATGENKITRTMNDLVLLEQFKIFTGASAGFVGSSWSVFDKPSGKWKQTWVDNQGSYLDLVGITENGSRIFEREFIKADGKKMKSRMVFKEITADKFTWNWEASTDDGKTWILNWQIFYTRKK